MSEFIVPDWPAPENVRALQTTRSGGVSLVPWASFNLGDHVGDDPEDVAANRAALTRRLPAAPLWLKQVHGIAVANADVAVSGVEADAAVARRPDRVCAIMTADCLPVLFCDRQGRVVAAAHAGWRGMLAGVLESTLAAMCVAPAEIMAWLGPAIGPQQFEVGDEVRAAFVTQSRACEAAFAPHAPGKWLADLTWLARWRLARAGVGAVYGGTWCTVEEGERFFSYRRDGMTGRMATLVWLES